MFFVLLEDISTEDIPTLASSNLIARICTNVANTVKAVGSYIILLMGLVLIIMAVIQIAKGFVSGKAQWLITLGGLLFGGLLIFGGWGIITGSFGATGKNTFDSLMGGMTPTAGTALSKTSGTTGTNAAQNAIVVLQDAFFVPFAKAVAVTVGIILTVMAVIQLSKYFMAKGNSQISWKKVAVMAVLGSVLFTATPTDNSAGWTWITNIAVGITRDTVAGAANGTNTSQTNGYPKPVAVTTASTSASETTPTDAP